MRKINSLNTKSKYKEFETKSTFELPKAKTISSEKEQKKILKKIPFHEDCKENIEIAVDCKMNLEENDRNYLKSIIIGNLNENEKRRLSRMRNELDDIFQTKVSIDQNKYLTYFRKGLSEKEKKNAVKEQPKLSFPNIQKKKIIDNIIDRGNPETNLKQSYQSVVLSRQKIFKDHYNIINKDIMVKLNNPIKLGINFNDKAMIRDKYINIEKDSHIESTTNKILYIKQFESKNIRKFCFDGIKLTNVQLEKRQEKRLLIYDKWKETIMKCYFEFKEFNISIDKYLKMKLVSCKPYELHSVKLVFRAIKEGKTDIAINMIKQTPFLLHNYNMMNQTPLHYAAKYNMCILIEMRSLYYSSCNLRDKNGKTPLHYAAMNDNIQAVKILLLEMANPMIKDNDHKQPYELTKDMQVMMMLVFASLLYKIHKAHTSISGYEKIKKGLNHFLNKN